MTNGTVMRAIKRLLPAVGALAVFVAPSAALAQTGCAVPLSPQGILAQGSILGILNETLERTHMLAARGDDDSPLAAGTITDGARIARAIEQGRLFNGCGTMAWLEGAVSARAESRTPVSTDPVTSGLDLGVGVIKGELTFAQEGHSAKIGGILDFTPTDSTSKQCNGGPCPFVPTSGIFSSPDLIGSFVGVALVPFHAVQGNPAWFYLDPTGLLSKTPGAICAAPGANGACAGWLVPLQPTDFNTELQPEAKFIVNFFE